MRSIIFMLALLMALPVAAEKVDFTLKDLDGKPVSLSDFRGKKPVALVFGSYT